MEQEESSSHKFYCKHTYTIMLYYHMAISTVSNISLLCIYVFWDWLNDWENQTRPAIFHEIVFERLTNAPSIFISLTHNLYNWKVNVLWNDEDWSGIKPTIRQTKIIKVVHPLSFEERKRIDYLYCSSVNLDNSTSILLKISPFSIEFTFWHVHVHINVRIFSAFFFLCLKLLWIGLLRGKCGTNAWNETRALQKTLSS